MKVLVTADIDRKIEKEFPELHFDYMGYAVGDHIPSTHDEMKAAIPDYDFLISEFDTIDKDIINVAAKLKMIVCCRGGVHTVIDVPYAAKKGVIVHNTPARNATSVAEYVLGVIFNADRNLTKADIYNFLADAGKAIMVVDCENSDPVKLAAALSSLSPSSKAKLSKILLFDSEYTTSSWGILAQAGNFPVEHVTVLRLNEKKSQVDMTLATRTCKEVYTNAVDSVILVSSDSDYAVLHFDGPCLRRHPEAGRGGRFFERVGPARIKISGRDEAVRSRCIGSRAGRSAVLVLKSKDSTGERLPFPVRLDQLYALTDIPDRIGTDISGIFSFGLSLGVFSMIYEAFLMFLVLWPAAYCQGAAVRDPFGRAVRNYIAVRIALRVCQDHLAGLIIIE